MKIYTVVQIEVEDQDPTEFAVSRGSFRSLTRAKAELALQRSDAAGENDVDEEMIEDHADGLGFTFGAETHLRIVESVLGE